MTITTSTATDATTTRNATLQDLMGTLREQHARKLDIVTPASQIRSRDGIITVKGAEPVLSADGVTSADGRYRPTAVFDEGVAAKLGISLAYLRRMRAEAPDLYDANVNGWLHGRARMVEGVQRVQRPADTRSFMLRLFQGERGGTGVARALVSDKFARYENLDILMAALDGIRAAGVEAEIEGGDLTDRRMWVRISAPEIAVHAPTLLRDYRSPFTGNRGADNPTVFAGFELSNSEVGDGAFTITPRLMVEVCRNGLQMTQDAVRAVHLGGKLDAGVIQWTEETQRKAAELVTAKTADAVRTFLNADYMRRVIDGMQGQAQTPLTAPAETIQTLSKTLKYDEATTEGILAHFIQGGDISAGGVLHAVTSYAQTVPDATTANKLEASALEAMALAATAAR